MAGTTRIRILAGTASWDGDDGHRTAVRGDVVDVPSDVAARWVPLGCAERVPDAGPAPEPDPDPKAKAGTKPKPKAKARPRSKGGGGE